VGSVEKPIVSCCAKDFLGSLAWQVGFVGGADEAHRLGTDGLGQPLEIDGGGCQQSLDRHILQAPPDSAGEPVLRLCLTVNAFDPPAVACVKGSIPVGPGKAPAAGANDGTMVGREMNASRGICARNAAAAQGTSLALFYPRPVPSPAGGGVARSQNAFSEATNNVVSLIVGEPIEAEAL